MPPVSIRPVEDLKWEYGPPAPGTDRRAGRCFHHQGTETLPQLFEVKLLPGQTVEPHAHEHNEIIYILGGELRLGNTVLKPGSSVAIKGRTIYGFAAGSDGVHFLNFRPCLEEGLLTVEEVSARKTRQQQA
jgi:quercetin dioxygenase-like cupin family protein